VGFMVMERLSRQHRVTIGQRLVSPSDGRPASVWGEYQEREQPIRLMMPLTMMNESGEALRHLAVAPSDLLIVCDDVNLPLGMLRARAQGSSGGHHGLQSCLDVLGTEQVPRLRIGVGTTPLPRDLEGFVLSRFERTERPVILQAVDRAVDACNAWVTEGIEQMMNRFNVGQLD